MLIPKENIGEPVVSQGQVVQPEAELGTRNISRPIGVCLPSEDTWNQGWGSQSYINSDFTTETYVYIITFRENLTYNTI